MQVGTGESKLLLFETFWLYYLFFFFLLERFLEELALLKNIQHLKEPKKMQANQPVYPSHPIWKFTEEAELKLTIKI